MVARIHLKHCVDPLALIEGMNLLRILPDAPQDRVPGLTLLVPQGEVDAVRPALGLMGEEVLLHAGKPEGAGHAAHPGKQIRLVEGVHGEQPGQGVPGDPAPTRDSINLLLCRWNNLFRQKPQIVVRTTGAGLSIFESRWTVPGHHVVVPVQITDGHQRERWAAGSLRGLIYIPSLVRKGVEVDNWDSCLKTWKNRYHFALGREGVHSLHHPLSVSIGSFAQNSPAYGTNIMLNWVLNDRKWDRSKPSSFVDVCQSALAGSCNSSYTKYNIHRQREDWSAIQVCFGFHLSILCQVPHYGEPFTTSLWVTIQFCLV